MTSSEIEATLRRYRARLELLLTGDELARHDAYQRRVQERLDRRDPTPVEMSPEEQAVADKIASDPEAASINRQFMALIRVEKLPQ